MKKHKPVKYDPSTLKEPRFKKLAKEHEKLDALCKRAQKINYRITRQFGNNPPESYELEYLVRSIVSIDGDKQPIYGNRHLVSIVFPADYPSKEAPPSCKMVTDVWHPNIRSSGEHKGRICITSKSLGAWHSLDLLAIRIGEILQYKNYLAENVDPFPEDERVASWVRNFGEPNNIVNKSRDIFTDNSELLDPEDGVVIPGPKPKPKPKVKIGRIRRRNNNPTPENPSFSPTKFGSISIRKRK